jgi:predicted amidophosphoribosyltransferase
MHFVVRAAFDAVGKLLAPPRCAACAARLRRAVVFCAPCVATINACEVPFQSAWGETVQAPLLYGGAVRTAILRLKYQNQPHLARGLGDLLAPLLGAFEVAGFDAVVPVPSRPSQLRKRGYNPAGLLAQRGARTLKMPVWYRSLRALEGAWVESLAARSNAQVSRSRAARLLRADVTGDGGGGLAGGFEPGSDLTRLGGRKLVLVDDIVTTGTARVPFGLDFCGRARGGAGRALQNGARRRTKPGNPSRRAIC